MTELAERMVMAEEEESPGGAAQLLLRLQSELAVQRTLTAHSAPRPLTRVVLMAEYLGLQFGGEHGSDALWLADAAVCAALPLGWETHDRPAGVLYRHVLSGDETAEHPQWAFLRGVGRAAAKLRRREHQQAEGAY